MGPAVKRSRSDQLNIMCIIGTSRKGREESEIRCLSGATGDVVCQPLCCKTCRKPSQVAVDVRRNPTPWYRAPAASVSYETFTRWAPLVTRRSIPADSIARARPRRWNSSSTLTGSTSPTFVVGSNQYSESRRPARRRSRQRGRAPGRRAGTGRGAVPRRPRFGVAWGAGRLGAECDR